MHHVLLWFFDMLNRVWNAVFLILFYEIIKGELRRRHAQKQRLQHQQLRSARRRATDAGHGFTGSFGKRVGGVLFMGSEAPSQLRRSKEDECRQR